MKLLCVSDQIDPLIYTDSIKQRFADIDMILCAGDLPKEYLEFIVSTLNKPLIFVIGNHHTQDFPCCKTGVLVDSKVRHEEGLLIAGLGGCIRCSRRKNQFTNFQMFMRMLAMFPALFLNRIMHGRFLDILLTHASPLGIHDKKEKCYRGFKCFLWFMRIFKPRYLVHGHMHRYDINDARTTRYFDTLVINAYSHYIIDTTDNSFPYTRQ